MITAAREALERRWLAIAAELAVIDDMPDDARKDILHEERDAIEYELGMVELEEV